MKLQKTKLGFTLIELMVVITIIGILATGATSVYTSQIQKARDSKRVTAIKSLQNSVEQSYSDLSEYPWVRTSTSKADSTVGNCSDFSKYDIICIITFWYMAELPKDDKSWSIWNGAPLEFAYNVDDANNVHNQVYELSCWFEAAWSLASKANNKVDKWWDSYRMEVWSKLEIVTRLVWTTVQSTEWDSTIDELDAGQQSCHQADNTNDTDNIAVIIGWNCNEGM